MPKYRVIRSFETTIDAANQSHAQVIADNMTVEDFYLKFVDDIEQVEGGSRPVFH